MQERSFLHLAVLTLVAAAALVGRPMYALPQPNHPSTAHVGPEEPILPAPEPQAMAAYAPFARPSPEVSAPSDSAPASSPKGQDETRPDALPQPNRAAALSIQETIRGVPDLPAVSQGQEEGVMAMRAMPSSRGGDRAPAPSASLTTIPRAPTSVPPAPTPTPKKQAMKVQTYKVQAGDTLLAIAARFGVTPETVLWANNLGNGELLQISEELTIPPVSGILHTVSKGETLQEIAKAHLAEVGKLMDANALEDADKLQEGQVLIIPGGMMTTTEVPGLPSAPSAGELASAPKYVVKQGDTLLSIADAFGVKPSVIQVANNLLNPDMLQVGAELSIPGGKAPAPKAQQSTPPAPAPAARPAAPTPTAKAAPAPPPAPAPAPAASGTATGDQIAALSQRYVGYRYVWGGTAPNTGFDCSGFVWYVYKQAGVSIPRTPLEGQLGAGPGISIDKLLPGDLVFWQNTYKAGLSHVGIYLGGGRFINAESEAVGVQIRSLSDPFWATRYVGAARPW